MNLQLIMTFVMPVIVLGIGLYLYVSAVRAAKVAPKPGEAEGARKVR